MHYQLIKPLKFKRQKCEVTNSLLQKMKGTVQKMIEL